MPISALVVTVQPGHRDTVLAELARLPQTSVGEPQASCIPVVVDTQSAGDGRRIAERVQEVPGVALVNVVMVDFRDEDEEEACSDASS